MLLDVNFIGRFPAKTLVERVADRLEIGAQDIPAADSRHKRAKTT
jgi:hypothetical protein